MKKIWLILPLFLSSCFLTRNALDVVEKTMDADHIIYNYEWFYDSYNEILSLKNNIQLAENQLSINYIQGSEEYSRRLIEINGMRSILSNRISEYNSKSSQITRNLWKSDNLPYQIILGETL